MTKWKSAKVADMAKAIHEARPARKARAEELGGCGFLDDLERLAATLEGDALRLAIIALPGWRWVFAVDALRDSADHYTGAALEECQVFWAARLGHLRFSDHSQKVSLLVRERGHTIVAAAWPDIIEWFAVQHPAPRSFFADPKVRAGIPDAPEINAALDALKAPGVRRAMPKRLKGLRAG